MSFALAGTVPFDEYLRKSVQRRESVVEAYPRSPAAYALRQLAAQVEQWPRVRGASGHLEFFFERMLQPSVAAVGGGA